MHICRRQTLQHHEPKNLPAQSLVLSRLTSAAEPAATWGCCRTPKVCMQETNPSPQTWAADVPLPLCSWESPAALKPHSSCQGGSPRSWGASGSPAWDAGALDLGPTPAHQTGAATVLAARDFNSTPTFLRRENIIAHPWLPLTARLWLLERLIELYYLHQMSHRIILLKLCLTHLPIPL